MCRNTDTIKPLASKLANELAPFKKGEAREMIQQHKKTGGGQQSKVTEVAEWLFKQRKKLGIEQMLRGVGGTNMQKSALREAVMMMLHERAKLPYMEAGQDRELAGARA